MTARGFATLALLVTMAAPATAQEVAVPDTPEVKTVKAYAITAFSQSRPLTKEATDWRFTIVFRDDLGNSGVDEHFGLTNIPDPSGGPPIHNPNGADVFLKQMNTMNFSTNSMVKRLLQHLVQHGKIPPSTVQGTPDTFEGDAFAIVKPAPKPTAPGPPGQTIKGTVPPKVKK